MQPELAAIAGTNAILAQRPLAAIESQMGDLDFFAIDQVDKGGRLVPGVEEDCLVLPGADEFDSRFQSHRLGELERAFRQTDGGSRRAALDGGGEGGGIPALG